MPIQHALATIEAESPSSFKDVENSVLDHGDWETIKLLIDVLQPLHVFILKMQSSSAILSDEINQCIVLSEEISARASNPHSKLLKAGAQKYFGPIVDPKAAHVLCTLDFRFKNELKRILLKSSDRRIPKHHLLEQATIIAANVIANHDAFDEPEETQSQLDNNDSVSSSSSSNEDSSASPVRTILDAAKSMAKLEIKAFKSMQPIAKEEDPFKA